MMLRRSCLGGLLSLPALGAHAESLRTPDGEYRWQHVNVAPFRGRGGTAQERLGIAIETFASQGVSWQACDTLRRMFAADEWSPIIIQPGFRLMLMMTLDGFKQRVVAEVSVAARRYDVVTATERILFLDPDLCDNWCIHRIPPTPPCIPVCSSGPCAPRRA